MIAIILFFDLAMVILDFVTISSIRKFLLDFLLGARNRKNVKKIHNAQSLKQRITLTYIKPLLKRHTDKFQKYHKMYMAVLYTLAPQYIVLIISNIIFELNSMYILGCFACIKFVICFIIRLKVDSNMRSVYAKKP